jgi:hypothetical protein
MERNENVGFASSHHLSEHKADEEVTVVRKPRWLIV